MSALKKIEFEKRTIEPLKDEKEYPHIIEKLEDMPICNGKAEIIAYRYPNNKEIKDKINEIIEVVNIMMRYGR